MAPKALEEIQWFHRTRLKDGTLTPGGAPVADKLWHYLFDEIPLEGRTVLDVGCWDGAFSFLAEQRGAARVVGLDSFEVHQGRHDGWDFLHDHFQSKAEFRWGNVYDLPPERFDVVLCYGLLYHLSDPLLAATNCFQRANEHVAFTGNFFSDRRPLLLLWESREIRPDDASNVYSLSSGYLDLVARQNGFARVGACLRSRGPGKLGLNFMRSPRSVKKDQGALLYRRVEDRRPEYPDVCYPLAPAR